MAELTAREKVANMLARELPVHPDDIPACEEILIRAYDEGFADAGLSYEEGLKKGRYQARGRGLVI